MHIKRIEFVGVVYWPDGARKVDHLDGGELVHADISEGWLILKGHTGEGIVVPPHKVDGIILSAKPPRKRHES